jgi:hypothetical protein
VLKVTSYLVLLIQNQDKDNDQGIGKVVLVLLSSVVDRNE